MPNDLRSAMEREAEQFAYSVIETPRAMNVQRSFMEGAEWMARKLIQEQRVEEETARVAAKFLESRDGEGYYNGRSLDNWRGRLSVSQGIADSLEGALKP